MNSVRVIMALPEALAVLALPPLLLSIIIKTKAWFAGRVGPPWLQPYYDLAKLIRKEAVYSRTTTWVFRAGPLVNLAALLTVATLIPVLTRSAPLGFAGDVILIAYLFALGRMFTVLAALDTGSAFEGMGAAREVTFGTMTEPALFLSFAVLAIAARNLQFDQIVGPPLGSAWATVGPALVLVVVALLIVLVTETCRVPVDDPATHLELTMIHEVMVLDHCGPDFALITYGAMLKFLLLGSILLHVALPHAALPSWLDAPLRLVELAGLSVLVGVLECSMARLRLSRVPLLLAGATVLAVLAAVLTLTRSVS